MDRRSFIHQSSLVAGLALLAGAKRAEAKASATASVVTPHGSTLPWKSAGGVKVGHLIASALTHEFAPGLRAECWGYNGTTPGPTIEAVEGDRLRLYVTNRLPEPTTIHWHGVVVPN